MGQNPFLSLFLTHRGALLNFASGIVGNRAQGEDVVQEAWLKFENAAATRLLDQPLAYLYRIVRNLAVDSRRRIKLERSVLSQFDAESFDCPDDKPSPEVQALFKAEYARVEEALAELPERTRTALEMHRFGGLRLKEIAEILGISTPLAHVLVVQGVRHCKDRLGWP